MDSAKMPDNIKHEYSEMFVGHLEALTTTRTAIEDACASKVTDEQRLVEAKHTVDSFRKDKKAWSGLVLAYDPPEGTTKGKTAATTHG